MSYIQAAFESVCQESKPAQQWYVCLIRIEQYYGGPEEGGWWGSDSFLVAYQEFASHEAATAAYERVTQLAAELQEQSQHEHGDYCNRQLDWLEARGLDADFLPEPDGPDRFIVILSEDIPEESRGPRHYE